MISMDNRLEEGGAAIPFIIMRPADRNEDLKHVPGVLFGCLPLRFTAIVAQRGAP
jgi:hypothetical protein